MKTADAVAKAIEHGAEPAEIERQATNYVRQVGTIPFRNMITALHIGPWNNGREEWTRLAAALTARNLARGRK